MTAPAPVRIAPAALVEGAARTPLPYGLFSVFTFRPTGGRWESGVMFEQLDCGPAGGIGAVDCDPDTDTIGLPKELDRNGADSGEASPFTVYGHHTCSPVGISLERAQLAATAHLEAREQARVEQAVWTGDLGNTPNLAAAAETLAGGTAVDIVSALSLAEDFIATHYGSLGVIHMSRGLALLGVADKAVTVNGTRLTTRLGTPVVAGAGYPGTGPGGEAPGNGQTWLYASPALFGYRSEVFGADPQIDRAQNDLYAIAERTYLIGWDDCGVAAVHVDTTA